MMREPSRMPKRTKRREEIESRNRADQAVYAAERMLTDTGDKLAAGDRAAIESAIADAKKRSKPTTRRPSIERWRP